MIRTTPITSAQNPKIKEAVSLGYRSDVRRERGLFLVEGRREVARCIAAGFRVRCIFWCPELLSEEEFEATAAVDAPVSPAVDFEEKAAADAPVSPVVDFEEKAAADAPVSPAVVLGRACETGASAAAEPVKSYKARNLTKIFEVPAGVYEKIAYRGGTEGIVAEVEWRDRTLADLQGNPSLLMVLEAVEKPGNLGAVLRSADAAGADALIICDSATDIYNPNVIRASVGAVFTVPTVCCSSGEAIKWLKDNGIQILTAQLQDSSLYYDTPMTGPTAIVMGTESTGLTSVWREAADAHIRIPMLGAEDSLNVSVSAAILLFEAVRQRFKSP